MSFLLSAKGISLVSMVAMIAVNPENALKISFSHFVFNLIMGVFAYVLPQYSTQIVIAFCSKP